MLPIMQRTSLCRGSFYRRSTLFLKNALKSSHGSDLGPLIFLIYSYMYDIHICNRKLSFYKLFADSDESESLGNRSFFKQRMFKFG